MNRESLVLYLENVKNLEVMRHHYKIASENTLNENKRLETLLEIPIKIPKFNIFSAFGTILSVIMLLAVLPLWLNYERVINSGETYLGFTLFMTSRVLPVLLLIFGIMLLLPSVGNLKNNLENISRAKKSRAKLIEDIPEIKNKIQQNINRLDLLTDAYDKTTSILINAYALNIIPGPYRNLKCMIFISDYMSTSQVSLDKLFQPSLIDNGVKKIEAQFENFMCANMTIIGMLIGEALRDIGIVQRLHQTPADAPMKTHFTQMINYYKTLNPFI